jgi:hypothetical protein
MITLSPRASADLKSTAHALLTTWFLERCKLPHVIPRYLLMACYHAETAIRYAEEVSPPGNTASSEVLVFLSCAYSRLADFDMSASEEGQDVQFKRCFQVLKARRKQVGSKELRAETKRLKQPNRYRCANPGCGIIADHGKMLSNCESTRHRPVILSH